MNSKIYAFKIHKLLIYLLLLLLLLFINKIISNNFISELNGINYIITLIAIPSTIIYYRINEQKNLYLYILIYISMLIEHFSKLIFLNYNLISNNSLVTPFLFRASLLFLILYKQDCIIDYILANKNKSIILTMLITFVLFLLDNLVDISFKNTKAFFLFYCFVIMYTSYMIFKLEIRAIKSKDFIQTLYPLSILLLVLRLMLYLIRFVVYNDLCKFIVFDKIFYCLSFGTLVIGLFVEVKYLLFENKKLNEDVESISNNIKEIKVVEKVRSHFFANISHELKTPLNIIFSCVQLLDSVDKDDYYSIGVKYSKYSKGLKQNCYRMLRLINNIVDTTKIDSGFIDMNFHNHDIVNLVENITMSVIPYMESRKINITFDTFIEELIIKCDSDSIERIILNLLSNSIKFSKENGSILVFVDADDDFVTINVIDDGIGIEDYKQNSVFDKFVQSDKSLTRKREGSGIGLSLVKSLVELHNGSVSLESTLNVGTNITIKLPNIMLDDDEITNSEFDTDSNSLISKINVEFSDIYE